MVSTLIDFIGFPAPGALSPLDERFRGSADGQAWLVRLLWPRLLKTVAESRGTAQLCGAWCGVPVCGK
jgi:hypothetical protein